MKSAPGPADKQWIKPLVNRWTRRTVVSLPDRSVGVPSCLAPPRPAAPRCAAPTPPAWLQAVWKEPLFVDLLWREPHRDIQGILF